jgi:hypothetical protein
MDQLLTFAIEGETAGFFLNESNTHPFKDLKPLSP